MSDYPYHAQIKSPGELGISDAGNLEALGKDIQGMGAYVNVLVEGTCKKGQPCASKTGGPMGNKYFFKTGGKCKEKGTEKLQDRYIYIDNVPSGKIPLINAQTGLKGLIPGMIGNMAVINPQSLFNAITNSSIPECSAITLETIDNNNKRGAETHFVAISDQKQGFATMSPQELPKDYIVQMYFMGLSILALYIFFRISKK